jgi:endonuclease YncB( thermonuclease family)
VDTPEKGHRAQCAQEDQRAQAASAWTTQLIKSAPKHQVILYKWDKFGGRVIGDIIVNGQSVRRGLIANGFAREYYGEAKTSWCN